METACSSSLNAIATAAASLLQVRGREEGGRKEEE